LGNERSLEGIGRRWVWHVLWISGFELRIWKAACIHHACDVCVLVEYTLLNL